MFETDDEYLTRCVVDTSTRSFNLYSNLGDEKVVKCDNMNEFMNALSFVRNTLDENQLVYASPL
jgi:imidazoleglycerol phosphate dehydratase HisB